MRKRRSEKEREKERGRIHCYPSRVRVGRGSDKKVCQAFEQEQYTFYTRLFYVKHEPEFYQNFKNKVRECMHAMRQAVYE